LSYANAGHDLPYLWHGGYSEELRVRGMPLGLMPQMSYEEKEIVLKTGEGVLFYSDGLVEAHNPDGEMFSFPRACYELGRKSHRNADSTVGLGPSRSTFPAFLSRF
jgi:serine phosphatase RsbU (regulator of sigma subunit)